MRALAKLVHCERETISASAARLSKSIRYDDQLQAGALQLGLFAARVILKSPPCIASVTVSAEALGIAATTPDEMLAELVARLHGGRPPESMETRRN